MEEEHYMNKFADPVRSCERIGRDVGVTILRACAYNIGSGVQGIRCYLAKSSEKPFDIQECSDPGLAAKVVDALEIIEEQHIKPLALSRRQVKPCVDMYRSALEELVTPDPRD